MQVFRAMTTSSVELGTLRFLHRNAELWLSLTSSCSIQLPAPLEAISAEELSRLVQTGQLWVFRPGTCLLEITTTIDGDKDGVVHTPSVTESLVEAVTSCRVCQLPTRPMTCSRG